MGKERKCILCETVHASKQEMDEHMRSMLHHRELEKLKGRDCGHECRVCKVKVVSLTDYASHISSPSHKQNVEAAEQRHSGNNNNEDYFDQELLDLIEKRKEQIRKEKEAAAAKQAKEEEKQRREEEFQKRLKEAKERYLLAFAAQQPLQRFHGSCQYGSWQRNNRYNDRPGEPRPWHHNQQGKSATWHAQEPPNFQKWGSGEFAGENNREDWNRRQWDQGVFSGNQQSRMPWLSNGGSSNGFYGQNSISEYPQSGRSLNQMGPPPHSFYAHNLSQLPNMTNSQGVKQGDGFHSWNGQRAESDHNISKSSKFFGSNPKLDKVCRWSPYPVTKGFESVPHKDNNPNSSDKYSKAPKPQGQDKAPGTSAFNRQSHPEQKPQQLTSGQSVEDKGRHKTNSQTRPRDESSSSSRSSSAQRDGHQNSSGPSNVKANKSLLNKDQKMSPVPGPNSDTQLNKIFSQTHTQLKPTTQQSGLSPKVPILGPLQSRQERQLSEIFKKARQIVLEKRGCLDSSINNRLEVAQHIVEEPQQDHAPVSIGVNKENNCRQNSAKPNLLDSVRPEKPTLSSSDSSQFLQSLQVTTSTTESSEPAASSRDDNDETRKKVGKETCLDEPMSAVEAGQSSDGDNSRSGETPMVSGSNTSSLSNLDLPSVLKRDLTKHISSKGKTGSHEPNLNIARRVRNVSESRRSDSEKDSGLKPTVRQLISSSGSRRNVNWEQVYQEVRKKQDKGKGMPRFGIEMVPYEQEEQSQEENDIPLLEGFHWETMDVSAPSVPRKRSLSESSIAPASSLSLFTQREGLSSEQQGSSVSPIVAQGNKDSHSQQEEEQVFGQFEANAQKQPDKLTPASVKALQRSESMLGDSSSGTEQFDAQGAGKRRRAAGDVPSADASCLEHNNKRRKVKSKKERLQIDQLLAVSLREEELSHSLQTVDNNLIQARAALQAAYLEVQRLMVVKQQMTVEMGSLRNKRIELLKGMQGTMEEAPQVKLKEEKMDSVDTEPHMSSSAMDTAAAAAAPSPSPPTQCASPIMPVVIKQEPQSPVCVSSELDSTTTELPIAPTAAAPPDPALRFHPTPERQPELCHTNTERIWENFGETTDCKDSFSELVETAEKATNSSRSCITPPSDSKASVKLLSPSRSGSEGGVVDCAASQYFERPAAPSAANQPVSPPELRSGKRVRKLKKRKVLKKAQGTEQPESSDTEIDGEAMRPRWLRSHRRPSGGSQVSTSTLPAEGREGDVNMEDSKEQVNLLFPTIKPRNADCKSSSHMVELPQVASAELTVDLDSEEHMQQTTACEQLHTDALIPAPPPSQVPDSSRPEPQSLACNEVTSTSDMDICKSSESDMPFPITMPKASSDASSDHGEDEMPTEGVFEGHQEAVNAMQIHNGLLYTCSGDRTVRAFSLVSHKCVAVFEGHSSKVNCLLVFVAPRLHHRLYSGSSDQTIRCYSLKTQELEQQFSLSDRVLCLHSRWRTLYAGLANGTVVTFNLKTNKQMDVFECHGPRAVSCLASSQEGARRILLVGSYDSTISVRDAKNGLLLRTLEGHTKTVLCMKVVSDQVFSGSCDQCVYAHNIHSGELVQVYKGHSHAVTVVAVLGKVMVTACLDKLVRVYDLQSHYQLQVYGGHKDMVMCMAIHKNMIYTGCYDGSVQAVKLNLMQNYRCWWHGCSLVFGLTEHLQQHLINNHTSANLQTLKCRWKNCEEFFSARCSSKQGMLEHMQKHAEEETELEP
ncbi:zinc finger protein 106 [Mastacembelus armatus]|uniref:Zinc finger protein 106a n=1 Tax=Mastacembelus armatus TaxID=205130 RepID=A0A3Q3KSA3_9TELE|nr:zinc finger protein 106 [Mastacembelus armatus]